MTSRAPSSRSFLVKAPPKPWIIEHWPKSTPFLAVYSTFFIFLFVFPRSPDRLLWIWLQLPVYWLHQFEKHVWSRSYTGGIAEFVNVRILGSEDVGWPLTAERVFWASVPLSFLAFPLSAVLADKFGPEYGLWMAYFSVLEAVAQLLASYTWWTISPGLLSSLLITLPIGAASISAFHLGNEPLSTHLHIIALEVAVMCHGVLLIWVLKFLRAKVVKGRQSQKSKKSRKISKRQSAEVDDAVIPLVIEP